MARKSRGMGIYRKVFVSMYGDEKYCTLSPIPPCGQGLWQMLLHGPQTGPIPGVHDIGEAAFAERLRWSLPAFRRAWTEIAERDMATADWRARIIYLPNAIFYNEPFSANVVEGWAEAWAKLTPGALKDRIRADLLAYMTDRGEGFAAAFRFVSEGAPQPSQATNLATAAERKRRLRGKEGGSPSTTNASNPLAKALTKDPAIPSANQDADSRMQISPSERETRVPREPPPSRPSGSEDKPAGPVVARSATIRAEPTSNLPPMDADVGDGRVPPMGGWGASGEHDAAAAELLAYLNATWRRQYTLAANKAKLVDAVKHHTLDELKAAVDLIAAKLAADRIGIEPLLGSPAKREGWVEQAKAAKPAAKPKPADLPLSEWKLDDILLERPENWRPELYRREPDLDRWPDHWLGRDEEDRVEWSRRQAAKHERKGLRAVPA